MVLQHRDEIGHVLHVQPHLQVQVAAASPSPPNPPPGPASPPAPASPPMQPVVAQSNADCQIPLGQQECSLKAQHKGYTMVVQHNVNSPYGCYEAHDSHVDGVFYNTESNTNGTCRLPQYTCLCPGMPPSPPALPPPSPPGAPPFPPGHHIVCVQHASESDAQAACASKPDPNTCRVLPPDTKSVNGNVFVYPYQTVASTCEQLGLFSPNTHELCRDAHDFSAAPASL